MLNGAGAGAGARGVKDFYTRPASHIFTEMGRLQESGDFSGAITLAGMALERQGPTGRRRRFSPIWRELSKSTPSAAEHQCLCGHCARNAPWSRCRSRWRMKLRTPVTVSTEGRNGGELLDLAESRVLPDRGKPGQQGRRSEKHRQILDATVARIEQLFQQPHDGVTQAWIPAISGSPAKDGGGVAAFGGFDYRRGAPPWVKPLLR